MKKQKPWLGFSLTLLATMTWGSLPVIAQQALKAVDAPTLVWIRFLVASLVLFALLGLTGKLPRPSEFSRQLVFIGAGYYWYFLPTSFSLPWVCTIFRRPPRRCCGSSRPLP